MNFFRYLVGGAFNTGTTYLIFLALSLAMPASAAYTISYAVGVGLSYLINTLYVFRTHMTLRTFLRFPSVYLIQYLFGLVGLTVLMEMGLESRLAMIVTIVLSIPLTFILTKLIVKG